MRLSKYFALLLLILRVAVGPALGGAPATDAADLFPKQFGPFYRATTPSATSTFSSLTQAASFQAEYSGYGQRFLVEVVKFKQDPESYSLLSLLAAEARGKVPTIQISNEFGTAGFRENNRIAFFKGIEFVRITSLSKSASAQDEFAKGFAETVEKGEEDIPALIKHLPNTELAQKTGTFFTHFTSLQAVVPNQTVLSVIETEGNADAAFVTTDSGKVLVVEFNTPQLAKENDDRIVTKIQELWKLGQPAPTAYKRVGNYSVFVFDAPDNDTAKKLIDQVKYEQVVQWLGDNPYIYKEAEKRYVETTLGVFIAVIKASGFALLGCLGLGGLIGALLFTKRRAQQRAQEAYSDAGGMLRLNLDELSPQTDPARLLGPGN